MTKVKPRDIVSGPVLKVKRGVGKSLDSSKNSGKEDSDGRFGRGDIR